MTLVAPVRGPGRPSTGARQRVLEAGLETLLAEGFAGLSYAKVAVRAGENKSLIPYYFGSRQGLVAAVAELVGGQITSEMLLEIRDASSPVDLVNGLVTGLWNVMDQDPRIARLYFDLSAVSVVDSDVRAALVEVKARWREVISQHLLRIGIQADKCNAVATYLMAGIEGLAIENLEQPHSGELEAARAIFIDASSQAITRLS